MKMSNRLGSNIDPLDIMLVTGHWWGTLLVYLFLLEDTPNPSNMEENKVTWREYIHLNLNSRGRKGPLWII